MITLLAAILLTCSPPPGRDWVIPKPTRAVTCAVAMMRGSCWHCRESGMRALHREAIRNPRMIVYVAYGIYDEDPEVRWRCTKLLRQVAPCPGCNGLGYWGDSSARAACGRCGGRRVLLRFERP